jgi:hypothetical protein
VTQAVRQNGFDAAIGPALPGVTHHLVTSTVVCEAPLNCPLWPQPVS